MSALLKTTRLKHLQIPEHFSEIINAEMCHCALLISVMCLIISAILNYALYNKKNMYKKSDAKKKIKKKTMNQCKK